MPTEEVHVGDVGTLFKITLLDGTSVVDVSGATVKQLVFKKPDQTTETKTAAFYTDGTDGIITYTAESEFLDTAGGWRVQAKVTLPSGNWSSSVQTFTVHTNL